MPPSSTVVADRPHAGLTSQTNSSRRPHELLLVDDDAFFTRCLAALINRAEDLHVCGTAVSGATLRDCLARCSPAGIVLDLMLGAESGLEVALDLRRQRIDTPVLFVSALANPSPSILRKIGRCSFWRKSGDDAGFLAHLRRTLACSDVPAREK